MGKWLIFRALGPMLVKLIRLSSSPPGERQAEKRGPKNPRKLTPQIRGYLEELVASDSDLKAAVLVQRVRRRFGVLLHVRTVENALRKKGRQTP